MSLKDLTTKQRNDLADILASAEYLPTDERLRIVETIVASLQQDGESLGTKTASMAAAAKQKKMLDKIQARRESPEYKESTPIRMLDRELKAADMPTLDSLAKMSLKEIDAVIANSSLSSDQRFHLKTVLAQIGAI